MNIRCPQCQTTFRVNPDRIPPQGVRAKCARCSATFMVKPPVGPTASAGVGAVGPTRAPAGAAQLAREPAIVPPRPAVQAPSRTPPAPPPLASLTPASQRPAPEQPASPAFSPFGARDPDARAERLARALVSDIVAYYPDRREKSLAEGTIRTEFREEILKSWEEYVAQVGLPLAKSTPHFRTALNKILAKGQNVF